MFCHEFIRCMPSHKDANFYLNIEKVLTLYASHCLFNWKF